MKSSLNTDKLAEMVRSKRGVRGLRAIAREIGEVSASTLSRIEQGHIPDLNTYVLICRWLEVPTDFFTEIKTEIDSLEKQIVAHLRADKILDSNTAESLITMIKLAYEHTRRNAG